MELIDLFDVNHDADPFDGIEEPFDEIEDPCDEGEFYMGGNDVLEYCDELQNECGLNDSDNASNCSIETELSFAAPDFSPCVIDEVAESITNSHTHAGSMLVKDNEADCEGNTLTTGKPDWKGFKFVGDNIDKNIHPSFQRYNNKTNSLHYFHYYALLDRIDLSTCSESLPSHALNLQQLLVSKDDIEQLESDAIVLFSRYYVYI